MKKFKINNDINEARYPEIFKKGGRTNGRMIINLNDFFTFS